MLIEMIIYLEVIGWDNEVGINRDIIAARNPNKAPDPRYV